MPQSKSRSLWPRLCLLWPNFVLLIFHSLHSIRMTNLNPVALAVQEIFTGVRKFKIYVTENGPRPLWPSSCMRSKLLFVVDEHTKCDVCSCSHFGRMDEIPLLKSRSMWPKLYPFWPTFVSLFLLFTVYLCAKFEPYSRTRDINSSL